MKYVFDYEKHGNLDKFNKVVLMSSSPRRIELLKFLNPKTMKKEIDERSIERKYMKKYQDEEFLKRASYTCCEISKEKSNMDLEDDCIYISSDTMVINDSKIYNKPKDKEEAKDMLYSYLGKKHYVVTSVCIRTKNYIDVFYTISKVKFVEYYKELDIIIKRYIDSNLPMDKAGAYGIQELDPRLVEYIEGDINTIIGLPVCELSRRIYKNKGEKDD